MKINPAKSLTTQIAEMIADAEKAAFQKGWTACATAVAEIIGHAPTPPMTKRAAVTKPTVAEKPPRRRKQRRRVLRNTGPSEARAEVAEIIKQNPGRLGKEIAAMAQGTVNKHTVRTQLRKLKKSEEIEQHGLRWYAKGAYSKAA